MRINTFLTAAALTLATFSGTAKADFLFSGGGSGTGFLNSPSEPWSYNLFSTNDWGSPGVSAGVTAYSRNQQAYGFDITFSGTAVINVSSVAFGNANPCNSTAFCKFGGNASNSPWTAFVLGTSSIAFRAQSASFRIDNNEEYFVNIFFSSGTPEGFEGRWVTDFQPNPTVPEPATMGLFGVSLGALYFVRRRKNS